MAEAPSKIELLCHMLTDVTLCAEDSSGSDKLDAVTSGLP